MVHVRRILEKLQDFRLLPVFVVVSMALGIWIGKPFFMLLLANVFLPPGSDFHTGLAL